MGRINKYANIYSRDGKLLRRVEEDGILHDYTIDELEQLVDSIAEDKDENGKMKNPTEFNNASKILFDMYQRYGNPHEAELLEQIKKAKEAKTTKEQVIEKLEEVKEEVDPMDHYVEFEEVAA